MPQALICQPGNLEFKNLVTSAFVLTLPSLSPSTTSSFRLQDLGLVYIQRSCSLPTESPSQSRSSLLVSNRRLFPAAPLFVACRSEPSYLRRLSPQIPLYRVSFYTPISPVPQPSNLDKMPAKRKAADGKLSCLVYSPRESSRKADIFVQSVGLAANQSEQLQSPM